MRPQHQLALAAVRKVLVIQLELHVREVRPEATEEAMRTEDLEAENKALRERCERSERMTLNLKMPPLATRLLAECDEAVGRAEKAELTCLLWSATFQKYQSFEANGKHTVKTRDVVDDYRSCKNDCGQTILARMKAMEEILRSVPHSFHCENRCPPTDDINCPACRWEKLKKANQ